jgi:hypothetical protein
VPTSPARKQVDEAPEVFRDVMAQAAEGLVAAALPLLAPGVQVRHWLMRLLTIA